MTAEIISQFDHAMVVSKEYAKTHNDIQTMENALIWDYVPNAENMLIYMKNILAEKLPLHIRLAKLKLFETRDSYAIWTNE